MPMQVPGYHTNTPLHPSFETDIRDVHLIYDYDAEGDDGKPQKWRYEMWFFSHDRIVYSIHGGPMAGRLNYQTVAFQCIRPGELWQCNWLEETGTIVSLVYDIINKKITTMIGFSKGHWENSKAAHGDKRNPEDYARWRSLADAGNQRDRLILSEQATILEVSKGAGDLVPIAPDAETLILMELLVWHDALGSDDEQATDEERAARLLYAHTVLDASVASTATDVEDDATQQQQQVRGMHALQFMEALVAFTRLMRCPLAGAPQWISVVLATRRFYVQEVEPHVFFALGVKTTELCGTDLRSVHAALLQQIYDMFCLLYGQIDRQLRVLSENVASQFDDGLALLHHIATLRRRLRKISLALELEDHDGHDSQDDHACMQRHEEETQLKQELAALVASSPSRMVWQRCDALFPTLLSGLEVQRMNMFHEVDGVAYFPMDETTFLSMQTLVNSFLSELHSVVSGGIALFFKGNVIWRTIDAHTLHTLQWFLCLREQDGMDVASPQSRVSAASDVWMAGKYDDAFSPIWASKTSYAECAVVHHIAPQPRRTSRFLHKQTPMSLNTLINELTVGNAPPSAAEELHRIRRSQRYRSDAPVYRNRGFLTTNGYFLPSWELAKPASDDMAWALTVYPNQSTKPSTALLYHENDLSLLVLTQTSGNNHTTLMRHMERIEDCVEKLQFTAMASTIWKNYLTLTGSQPSREKVSSTSQSPYIYLNRVNLAFKVSDQIPRLVKTKDADLYPRPASLWAHYFPTASLELLNDAHETLQSDHETIELRIKTVNDGWLVAHRSRSSDRELYALLDTKTASVTDAQDATTDLLAAQFSNIYL